MTLPAIGALRERWPDAHIEVLGYPHVIDLALEPHYANGARSIEASAMAGFFVPKGILEPRLMDYFGSFQLVISYLFDPDEVFADNVRRCGVKQLIRASPRPSELPAAQHYCKPLEALAIYVEHPRPRIYVRPDDQHFADQWQPGLDCRRCIAVHAGSGGEKKNWPVEKFAELSRWAVDHLAAELLLVKGEADELVVTALANRLEGRLYRLLHSLRLTQLAAVLERCVAFVGNDSGITHLAASVSVPTVALFGPASIPIWEPQGEHVRVIPFGKADLEQVKDEINRHWMKRAGR